MHDRYKLFTYTTHTPTMFITLASYYNSTKVKVKGQFSADYDLCTLKSSLASVRLTEMSG